ncbi:MAG: hypothetical protein DRJ67_01110 [Thermoprotei archaeon]|nr:MAG: hypothetical protein DRJ67_01110 [Thermoprotei archaeon]
MRIALVAGKATSLLNVAKDIAYVAQQRGHVPRIMSYVEAPSTLAKLSDAVILIYPASPLFCAEYMLLYRDLKIHYDKPALYYTMIEGRPRKVHIAQWMLRDVEFIACSRYVRDKLQEVGFKVRAVIPHGLVREVIEEGRRLSPIARKHLQRMHGDKVIFGVVSHSHVRKGLNFLSAAVRELAEKRDDFVVHLVTNPEARRQVGDNPHIYVDTVFGTRSREEIMAFLSAVDYLIMPSLAEGFGLPLVEANACGTLAIHCAYPPLTEISDLENNIVFEYNEVRHVYTGEGIEYEFHIYEPKILAQAMDYAIDLVHNYRSEYEERSAKVRSVLDRLDAEKIYPSLLRLVGA